jgi:hypothetical protein
MVHRRQGKIHPLMRGTWKKGDKIIDFDNKDVGNKEFKILHEFH